MSRLEDIRATLKYSESKRQSLMNDMHDAKKNGLTPDFICQTVGDILSSSRECYDYCGKDIVEEKIIPNTTDQRLITRYHEGKIRAYFPFYRKQLTNNKNLFYQLNTICSPLYRHLLNLADKIQSTETIPKTSLKYKDINRLNQLVNQKKHDRLIAIETNDNKEILIEGDNMHMIIPLERQKGFNQIIVDSKMDISEVSEFKLESINEEVGRFCMIVLGSTKIVIEEVYADFF